MALQNYVDKAGPAVAAAWLNAVDKMLNGQGTPGFGQYSPIFQSGYLQYVGASNNGFATDGLHNNITGNTNFLVGLAIPNPSGTPAPALLLGSGVPQAWLLTDAVVGPTTPGINLGITAGSTDNPSTAIGGQLTLYGGASASGYGGIVLIQGGTSVAGHAGDLYLQGGNSSGGGAGNVYVVGGQAGSAGGSVHLVATNTGVGTPGSVIVRINSTVLYTFGPDGEIYQGANGPGQPWQVLQSGGAGASAGWGNYLAGTSAVQVSGAITGGFVSGTLNWAMLGGFVMIWATANLVGPSSGPNDLIISGLPAFLSPAQDKNVYCGNLMLAGGTEYSGQARIANAGAGGGIFISLLQQLGGSLVGVGGKNLWNGAGNKGILAGWSVCYTL